MSRKTLKWLWRAGVLGVYILVYVGKSINELFLHTDNFLAGFAGMLLVISIPDMRRQDMSKWKGFFVIGGYCALMLASAAVSTEMNARYGTDEVLMPIYGEYMVTSGKRDRVLISTRRMRIKVRYINRGRKGSEPEYIYLMEKGTGTEENILELLRRRYGPEVKMKDQVVSLGGKALGFCHPYKGSKFDRVVFTYFDSRPFPDE